MTPTIEIDGESATDKWLRHLAQVGYGHFTAMQVRDGRVRGLAAHLARLTEANREMFDSGLDPDRIRAFIRHALGAVTAASVRTAVVLGPEDRPGVMVTVRPPARAETWPHRVLSVPYRRPLPHLKQIGGGFGQFYYHRLAQRGGHTEILLVDEHGEIAEGGVTNVGFFDGTTVLWPSAPALAGVTMRLVEPLLPSVRRSVRLADLPSFAGMFVTNSHGVQPVGRVDHVDIPVDPALHETVSAAYESVPWDRI